ncbi:probable FeS assembly SUF system protein SufT [Methylomagnum ishizawai]|uniref:Probable FeS assembly SUF system protein SufT n=1 Tax=Methylomagnum ishizawai TaxID=1760988 RepID=A0A1Y6CYJ6_9GAMM|nr:putative Fe-S cluster assembly protein SufT [Methylomagnum ishizawai]SMF95366.1 probable FeS assembly SUF system protein SufT [Methylomagnum ishizawai]
MYGHTHGYGRESIALQREVNVVNIPEGTPGTLPAGHIVTLYQSLGGNFTVTTEWGYMVRIAGEDADALGKEPPALGNLANGTDPGTVERNAWEILKTIFDPEIPVNIVDLGLVYHCGVRPREDGLNDVHILMTLTAPGCGMGPVLQYDAEAAVKNLPGVGDVRVEVVFDPPWSRDRMSEVAKLQLGMI